MAESDIYASPDKILALAETLAMTANSLRDEIVGVDDKLSHLGATWRDEEYNKFKRVFSKLSKNLEAFVVDIRKQEPELKEDANRLIAYLQKEIPGN
jgi:uncharacterized protein YukE